MAGAGVRRANRSRVVDEGRSVAVNRSAHRRLMAIAIAGLLLASQTLVSPIFAQAYPDRPIRLIVPFPPGGATDTLARFLANGLSERLGQQLVADNRAGAAGRIGFEIAAKARPDGYTLLIGGQSGLAIAPNLYKKLGYDPTKDLAPISQLAQVPNMLLVRTGLPIKTLLELVAYARARPGKLNFGSGGIGNTNHLAGELLNHLAGTRIIHVPYKGVNQAMLAMVAEEVDIVVIGVSQAPSHVQSGKARPIAALTAERLASFPSVPTSAEAGYGRLTAHSWYGLLVPAGTSREIIGRLNSEWLKLAATPDAKEILGKAGFDLLANSPDEFAAYHRSEIRRWGEIIKAANIASSD